MFALCFFCTLQTKNRYMYGNNPIGQNSNLQIPLAEFKFLEIHFSLALLFRSVDRKITINENFGVRSQALLLD
jgi:hypothetical protein